MVSWLLVAVVWALTIKPLGTYIARVFLFERTILDTVLGPLEHLVFRIAGVRRDDTMGAVQYGQAFIASGLLWALATYALLRVQNNLPWNPMHFGPVTPLVAFNTATSFVTNTNWQIYAGEHTLSDFSQFGVLGFLHFVSAGMAGAVAVAFIRAISGRPLGNFFVDLTLMCTRVLLPLSILVTVLLVWQGVPQTLGPYLHVHTLSGPVQVVPRGPMASWDATEHLGTNGGGFTAANSANPLENPTAASNLIETIAMGICPVAFFYAFGVMTRRPRLAWVLVSVAASIMAIMLALLYFPETFGNPAVNALGLLGHTNMVGKELRFGLGGTSIFDTATMAFSAGSVASSHDSWLPLSSLAFFIGMFLNLVFGGFGVGLLNMLTMVIITIFVIGLMVGRTPEFLGKKLEAREISLASIAFLIHPLLILVGTAIGAGTTAGRLGITNPGPHGLSEILYGFTSGAANNGSAFAGLHAAQPFYALGIGVEMVLARFVPLIALIFLAESLMHKKAIPETAGTLQTDTPLFAGILFGTIAIVNALTFFPVTALGPLAEHYWVVAGHLFCVIV